MDAINDEGWIKLHRKIINSQVFQSEGLLKVWIWCMLKANHGNRWVSIKTGKGTSEVFVKRGQFVFGRKTAAKELKMVERTVHKRMLKLKTMRNCDIQSDTHYSIVSVLNYEIYQGSEKDEVTGKVTGKGQASDTNKNYKNYKNNIGRSKKDTDPRVSEFKNWWSEILLQEKGVPYHFDHGKDGAIIKKLLPTFDLPDLKRYTLDFLQDEEGERKGFTIGVFSQAVNRIAQRRGADPIEQIKRRERLKKERGKENEPS